MSIYQEYTDGELRAQLKARSRFKPNTIQNMLRGELMHELGNLDAAGVNAKNTRCDRPTTTEKVRLHIDLDLDRPHTPSQLRVLASTATAQMLRIAFVIEAPVTQIIPVEANFDWQGQ